MSKHPAIHAGNVAVITGGADGIGKAAAAYYLAQGMRVCIADIDTDKLAAAAQDLGEVLAVTTDVSSLEAVQALKASVYDHYGRVDVLMNNAGGSFGGASWDGLDSWHKTLEVNLFGVIHGVQTFVPAMLAQDSHALLINTGSKQGITNPPGDPAYNTSKAAIKALTEHLAHDLRNTENCKLSAHLLIPGFTYTGVIRQWMPEKPEAAWWPEQVVEYMVDALERGDFYILCPDNDVNRETDNKRMAWTMGDLTDNRPALSRWHPAFEQAFAAHMQDA
jgi:NAD(P)-dependent dehydrogenase (short-subunit alcohol dehydrogenase family)